MYQTLLHNTSTGQIHQTQRVDQVFSNSLITLRNGYSCHRLFTACHKLTNKKRKRLSHQTVRQIQLPYVVCERKKVIAPGDEILLLKWHYVPNDFLLL